jgi:hypothetical protein
MSALHDGTGHLLRGIMANSLPLTNLIMELATSGRLLILLFFIVPQVIYSQDIRANKQAIIISSIKGTSGKPDTLELISNKGRVNLGDIIITGEHAKFFSIVSASPKFVDEVSGKKVIIAFRPDENFTGIARATLQLKKIHFTLPMTGLSTTGLEGENEAPLSLIVDALGYGTDVGWKSLSNNLHPMLQGQEMAPALFKKSDVSKPVEMIPVARYSPDFPVQYGLYTETDRGPRQHHRGILAKADKFPEHQMLFPDFSENPGVYDPGDQAFGFYASSPSHTVYSEDVWNILFYPSHATHAMRIYPLRTKQGTVIHDDYLVCMEEAANGDYNDYVFIVRNVKPVFAAGEFTNLTNGRDLAGWYTWLQSKGKNNDPEKVFTVEGDGVIHDTGKELGYIMTEKSFGNFHFILEFKWGIDRWPPRQNSKRDSGICYNIPESEPDGIWPQSVECQIQEGDVGDFWLLGYSTIQVDGKQNIPERHSQVIKKKDAEKSNGEWNTVEVISFNGKCVHIVNGIVVNFGENSSLIGGRILLQSEFAEVYYRKIRVRAL